MLTAAQFQPVLAQHHLRRDRGSQRFQPFHRQRQRRIGQQQQELLATVAEVWAEPSSEDCANAGHPAQDAIAGLVPVFVVDLLEAVQIQQRHAQRPAAPGSGVLHRVGQPGLAGTAVGQAGQGVVAGLVGQLFQQRFAFAVGQFQRAVLVAQFTRAFLDGAGQRAGR